MAVLFLLISREKPTLMSNYHTAMTWVSICPNCYYIPTRSDGMRRIKVRGTGRFGEDRPPYRPLASAYSCRIESREMKEDKYRAERSDSFELVSIEQAKDEIYSATS